MATSRVSFWLTLCVLGASSTYAAHLSAVNSLRAVPEDDCDPCISTIQLVYSGSDASGLYPGSTSAGYGYLSFISMAPDVETDFRFTLTVSNIPGVGSSTFHYGLQDLIEENVTETDGVLTDFVVITGLQSGSNPGFPPQALYGISGPREAFTIGPSGSVLQRGTASILPEPASSCLIFVGLTALAVYIRRRAA